MNIDFKALGHCLSCWINWILGGPREMTFSAYSFELLMNREGAAALWGAWRVQLVDAFVLMTLGQEFHCLDSWLRHKDRTHDADPA